MSGKVRDLAGVEAEFGVPARLMLDYQMLVGDTVDNVPGVPGVGPKTAVKLLQEYGSVDAADRAGRSDQGRGGREAAQGPGLAAHGPPAADHQDRLRTGRLGARPAGAGRRAHGQPHNEPLKTF
jgi:DNA polymerase-1